jgi:hypothetical protein
MTIVLTANKIISREFTVNSLVDSQITPNRKKRGSIDYHHEKRQQKAGLPFLFYTWSVK